jgi:OmpA-OmpF porin, OOP family
MLHGTFPTMFTTMFCTRFVVRQLFFTVFLTCSAVIDGTAQQPQLSPQKRRLDSAISTYQPTILPVLTSDGMRLYFDRKHHPDNTGTMDDFDEMWFADRLPSGLWSKPQRMGAPLNTAGSDVLCSLSPDDRNALVYGVYDRELPVKTEGFSLTRRVSSRNSAADSGGQWQFPVPIHIENFYNRTKKYYARLAPDNRTLLLALQRDNSLGGLDLYVSFRRDTSLIWTEPLHLGKTLNTSNYEGSPYLAADGRTLYFSSEGLDTARSRRERSGIADLYMTRRLDDSWQRWSEPVSLGDSINTGEEDSSISLSLDGSTAYFVSSERTGAMANDSASAKGLYSAVLPDSLRQTGAILLSGRVLFSKGLEKRVRGLPAETKMWFVAYGVALDSTGTTHPEVVAVADMTLAEVNAGERYALALPKGRAYVVEARLDAPSGSLVVTQVVDAVFTAVTNVQERFERRTNDVLFSEGAQTLTFPHIHFPQEQSVLSIEEQTTAGLVMFAYKTMMDNPRLKLTVEITGHTCDLGSNAENDALGMERATNVAAVLEDLGVAHKAMLIRSYGERKPFIQATDEESRKQNRRVEVRLIAQ